jgi:hypothetical protein
MAPPMHATAIPPAASHKKDLRARFIPNGFTQKSES